MTEKNDGTLTADMPSFTVAGQGEFKDLSDARLQPASLTPSLERVLGCAGSAGAAADDIAAIRFVVENFWPTRDAMSPAYVDARRFRRGREDRNAKKAIGPTERGRIKAEYSKQRKKSKSDTQARQKTATVLGIRESRVRTVVSPPKPRKKHVL